DVSCNCGTLFELKRGADGEWHETVLHAFTGGTNDGANPFNMDPILNGDGQIFGTTSLGGAHGIGTIFELCRNANGRWNIHVVHSFRGGDDGANPAAGVIFVKGRLFGTTYAGGNGCTNPGGCGTVYELTRTTGGQWAEKIIHRFHFTDGDGPTFALL